MNILVTGGASGLGEAITRLLASSPENYVYFSYANSESNANSIMTDFNNVKAIKCDFKNLKSLNSFKKQIEEIDLDVLINNAFSGDFLKSYFHKTDSSEFLSDFTENIIPVIEITQTVTKVFRKKKSGKIITILSAALLNTPPIGSAIYVANKAYLEKLTKVWATENSKFNITSNSVSPAFMETKLTSDFDERIIEHMITEHPLKKLLTVQEVAETVAFFKFSFDTA